MLYFGLTLFVFLIYLFKIIKKSFHMLQQNYYNRENRYIRWVFKNLSKVISIPNLLAFFPAIIAIFIKSEILYILVAIIYVVLYRINDVISKKEQTKKPLVWTSRVKRLIATFIIVTVIIMSFMLINFNINSLPLYYLILAIYSYIIYLITYLINIINIPVEKIVYYYYFNKATSKRVAMSNLKVVGVTGSYGKTSSKNILSTILGEKYRVLASPKSYNTAFGLMRTINENLTKFDEIFVAEMGAVRKHDIKEEAKIVKPNYAIVTRIGIAHLETFKTEEAITNTKFELVESLNKDGVAVLNADDNKQLNYKIRSKCKIIWIGIDNIEKSNIYAKNIKYGSNGTQFDVVFKDLNETYSFETELLGYASVYNIIASLAIALEFGFSPREMQRAVKKIKPVEHRLQLKNMGNNLFIIDDSFNSNPIGSKMALDVLKIMPGKRIVVTPGMIELDKLEDEKNKEFGCYMAECVDYAILVGEKKTKPIYDGLVENKFPKEKIYVINDVKEAFKIIDRLKDGKTYALLENDLPDLFNEK